MDLATPYHRNHLVNLEGRLSPSLRDAYFVSNILSFRVCPPPRLFLSKALDTVHSTNIYSNCHTVLAAHPCPCTEPQSVFTTMVVFASQGVLLLNAVLTVRAHQANSHKDRGWETFTDAVIKWLSVNREGVVFLLWGSYAHKKGATIDRVGVLFALLPFYYGWEK